MRKYLHFRVEIDVHKPLALRCLIPYRHANSLTSKLLVEFRYERLPIFLYQL